LEKVTERDKIIGGKVSALLREIQVRPTAFCQRAGIDQSYFSKLLKGSRRWNSELIDKVVNGFLSYGIRINSSELLDDERDIPRLETLELDSTESFKRKMLEHTATLIEGYHRQEKKILELQTQLQLIRDYIKKEIRPQNERRKCFLVLKEMLRI